MELDSDTPTSQPMPSIGDTQGCRTQNNLNETTARMGAFAVMACCLDAALELIAVLSEGKTTSLALDTFRTDHRPPATIQRVGNQYLVSRRNLGS